MQRRTELHENFASLQIRAKWGGMIRKLLFGNNPSRFFVFVFLGTIREQVLWAFLRARGERHIHNANVNAKVVSALSV